MSDYNSETRRARTVKFVDGLYLCFTKHKLTLEFSHAYLQP